MTCKLPGVLSTLALPLLLILTAEIAVGADLLRYVVSFDPFEVELTLPNGAKGVFRGSLPT
jgi:hypothetical protein